jgi:hypothetical protein
MTRYSRVFYKFHNQSDKENIPDDGYLEYLAHNKSGKAIARLAVSHRPAINAIQQTDFYTGKPVVDTEMTQTDTPINSSNWNSVPYTRPAQSGEQLVMFGDRHIPAKRTASSLYSENTLAGKTSAMVLLGMADNASTEAIGKNLVPDYNLSPHSGALVDRLHEEGHISSEDMPIGRVKNSNNFSDSERALNNHHTGRYGPDSREGLEEVSSRVPAARTRIRDLIGRTKKGEEHTQLSLWDD